MNKFLTLLLPFALITTPVGAVQLEKPSDLQTAAFIPADLLSGEDYELDAKVRNDGVVNTYVIQSRFGDFQVTGTPMLYSRLREVHALAEMEAISKTDVYLEGAKEAGLDMVEGVGNIFTDPVGTAKAVPTGVSRMLGGVYRGVQRGGKWAAEKTGLTDEDDLSVEEDLRRSHELVDTSQREWAQTLEIDPYTSNAKMREALSGLAFVNTLGDWTTGLVASVAVPVAGLTTALDVVGTAFDDIYTQDPKALRKKNREIMLAQGADEELADAFLDSGWYSPTLQTLMVRLLAETTEVENRWLVLAKALQAGSEAEARFFAQSLLAVSWYKKQVAPITAVLDDGSRVIAAHSEQGHYVLFVPADHLMWTETVADAARSRSEWATANDYEQRTLVIMGEASDNAREQLQAQGWQVHEQVDESEQLYRDWMVRRAEQRAAAEAEE